jgi:hypothetical protein
MSNKIKELKEWYGFWKRMEKISPENSGEKIAASDAIKDIEVFFKKHNLTLPTE